MQDFLYSFRPTPAFSVKHTFNYLFRVLISSVHTTRNIWRSLHLNIFIWSIQRFQCAPEEILRSWRAFKKDLSLRLHADTQHSSGTGPMDPILTKGSPVYRVLPYYGRLSQQGCWKGKKRSWRMRIVLNRWFWRAISHPCYNVISCSPPFTLWYNK